MTLDSRTFEFLPDRKHAPAQLGDVLILGLGVSGKAVLSYCARLLGTRISSLTVAAGSFSESNQAFVEPFQQQGVTVAFDVYDIQGSYDLCIASPGISAFEPFYQSAQAASTEIIGEVEFAWRESAADAVWVAITGTNGKTTTTSLASYLVQQAGLKALPVGNIGDSCINAVSRDAADIYVCEISSYQLASTRLFAPTVAVLMNITPDHLHWHKTHEAYRAAKLQVFANLSGIENGLAVLDATDPEAREQVKAMRAQGDSRGFDYLAIGNRTGLEGDMRATCGAPASAFVKEGILTIAFGDEEISLVNAAELQIKGAHNVSNALAASAVALRLGADPVAVRDALRSFAPLEHRIEPCGSIKGVECYNDSKATNVDATLKALSAFVPKKPLVLLGGDDKGTSLDELVVEMEKHAKAAVCFGDAGERFFNAFEGSTVPRHRANHLEDALDQALALAQPGDIVLLSPACASFDEFRSFEERGRVFKRYVADRRGSGVS